MKAPIKCRIRVFIFCCGNHHGSYVEVVSSSFPSCVVLNSENEVIVGIEARNQARIYPENTALSVKRSMGIND